MVAALACFAVLCTGATAAPRTLTTGVSNFFDNDPINMTHVGDAGGSMTLMGLRWGAIAPSDQPQSWNPADPADPNYEWEHYDAWIRNAVAAGLTPVIQIRSAPAWAERCVGNKDFRPVCDPDPEAFAAFAHAAAERYSGRFGGLPRVKYWEGINEPNLFVYFEPQYRGGKLVSPQVYRTLLDRFYAEVKGVDPTNLVLAPGLAPVAVKERSPGGLQFAKKLLCMKGSDPFKPLPGDCGGGVPFDIFDIHPYTTGGPTHSGGSSGISMGDLGKVQRLLTAADAAGHIRSAFKRIPLWITEFSWDSKPPDPGGLAMKIEMQWIPEALYQSWLHGVSVFMWYSLEDELPPPGSNFTETDQSGLFFAAKSGAEARPKPLLRSFRFPFVAFAQNKGLRFWGRTPTSRSGKVRLQVREGSRWKSIGSVRAKTGGIFAGLAKSGYGADGVGAVRAVFAGQPSPGFPMKRVGDFPQPPFGCCA